MGIFGFVNNVPAVPDNVPVISDPTIFADYNKDEYNSKYDIVLASWYLQFVPTQETMLGLYGSYSRITGVTGELARQNVA